MSARVPLLDICVKISMEVNAFINLWFAVLGQTLMPASAPIGNIFAVVGTNRQTIILQNENQNNLAKA
jgi:hypothetical protein